LARDKYLRIPKSPIILSSVDVGFGLEVYIDQR